MTSAVVRDRARALLWSLLVPTAGALLVLFTLIPSRMSAPTGAGAALARFSSEHPLIVGLLLFMAISATIQYWRTFNQAPDAVARAAGRPGTRWRLFLTLAVAAAAALVFRTFVAGTYRVTSVSMLPTLNVGDRVLVDKTAYGLRLPFSEHRIGAKLPHRGDLVVVKASKATKSPYTAATAANATSLVKRVLGLPGDHVVFQNGLPSVNGFSIPACDAGPYIHARRGLTIQGRVTVEYLGGQPYLTVYNFGDRTTLDYTVRPGEVFLVGDDRGASSDSRIWNYGQGSGVPIEDIEGRVTRVLFRGLPDGRMDLHRPFARPGIDLRQPGADLSKVEGYLANCLKSPPPSNPPEPVASR
jgi:signal peptidase I